MSRVRAPSAPPVANVPLRDVAVLHCHTLIERSSVTGRAVRYEPIFGRHHPISQARVRRSRTECRRAANVPLRCVAVLRCRTLIERSSVTGRAVRYESVFDRHHPISQARVRRSRTECRRAGSPKSTRSFCEAKDPSSVSEGWQLFGGIRAYSSVG